MLRRDLILLGIPIGLAAGVVAWFAAGNASANADKLSPVLRLASGLRAPVARADAPPLIDIADLTANPVFAMTVGAGAVKEPALRVDGISISRRRIAALVSINGQQAEWLAIGDSRDGVTLQQVQPTRVVLETPFGAKEVALGAQTGPPPGADAASASSPPPGPVGPDTMPPGFRGPPPPASAPKVFR